MSYEFQPNSGIKTKTELDIQNCVISGNKVQYSLKNGSIMQYEIDSNGEVVTTGENANVVELTKYQLSVFDALRGRDGDDTDLKKADLKNLSEEEIIKLVNEKIKAFSSFSAVEAKIDKKSITIKFKNGKKQETKLQIEFKSNFFSGVGKFFKNIFSSDKKSDLIPSIEVGNLEESPIKVDENGESIDEDVNEVPQKSRRELKKIAKKKAKQAKINSKNYQFKGEIIPQTEYTMTGDKYVIDLANELGVPLYCIKNANPTKDLDTLRLGETIIIPERKSIAGLSIKTSADVASATGFSDNFIDILQYNEGWNEKPYWDKVRFSVGYGHSGRILGKYIKGEKDTESLIIMTEKNVDKISLSKEDANEILAQDLLIRIAEAEARFGEDFKCAPKSLQAGIVDIIFNAGVERGFEGDKTKNIQSNLEYAEYTSAVKNLLIYPNNPESYKRNCYRIILALEDFSREDRKAVLNDPEIKAYFDKVKNYLNQKNLPGEVKSLDEKCQDLLSD